MSSALQQAADKFRTLMWQDHLILCPSHPGWDILGPWELETVRHWKQWELIGLSITDTKQTKEKRWEPGGSTSETKWKCRGCHLGCEWYRNTMEADDGNLSPRGFKLLQAKDSQRRSPQSIAYLLCYDQNWKGTVSPYVKAERGMIMQCSRLLMPKLPTSSGSLKEQITKTKHVGIFEFLKTYSWIQRNYCSHFQKAQCVFSTFLFLLLPSYPYFHHRHRSSSGNVIPLHPVRSLVSDSPFTRCRCCLAFGAIHHSLGPGRACHCVPCTHPW